MKNFKILSLLSLVILIFSCRNDSLTPVLTFDKATVGAYPRLVELRSNELDLANLSAAVYDYSVDFVDKEDGALVAEYKIDVQFYDNNPGNGDSSQARKTYKTYGKSDFKTSAKGNPGVDVKITLAELLSFFDLSADDLKPNDQFGFFTTVTTDGGQSYTSQNSSSTVRGSAFQGFFDNSVKATCPLPDDKFAGTYKVSWEAGGDGGFGYPMNTETVTLSPVSGSTTKRSFTSNWAGYTSITYTIDFVCDFVELAPKGTGLGCGGGEITLGPAETPASVDISNDSSFKITFVDYVKDGGCNQPQMTKTVILTKQ